MFVWECVVRVLSHIFVYLQSEPSLFCSIFLVDYKLFSFRFLWRVIKARNVLRLAACWCFWPLLNLKIYFIYNFAVILVFIFRRRIDCYLIGFCFIHVDLQLQTHF